MSTAESGAAQDETILVRYWASARAAAGTPEDRVPATGAISLAELRERVLGMHPEADRLADVLAICSALVGDAPVGSADPAEVVVRPGDRVEFLPPFAGG